MQYYLKKLIFSYNIYYAFTNINIVYYLHQNYKIVSWYSL